MIKYFTSMIILFAWASISLAVDLPWTCTFDTSSDWQRRESIINQSACNGDPGCCGIANSNNTFCDTAEADGLGYGVLAIANNPSGGGGRGLRQWFGNNRESSIGPMVIFSGQTDIWIRWYVRYHPNIPWGSTIFHKGIYVNDGLSDGHFVPWNCDSYNWGNIAFNAPASPQNYFLYGMGYNQVGDGDWHAIEVRLKVSSGEAWAWIDGEPIQGWALTKVSIPSNGNHITGIDYQDDTIVGMTFGHNMNYISSASDCTTYYHDIDDISIATAAYPPSGGWQQDSNQENYIGLLNGDSTPPTVDSVAIETDGTSVTLTCSENVTGTENDTFDLDCDQGNDIALAYSSGSGTSALVFTSGSTIMQGETCYLDFDGDPGEFQDDAGNDLADFTDESVTNNSEQLPEISVTASDATADEKSDTGIFTIACSPNCVSTEISFTMSGTAVEDADYTLSDSGSITITGASDTITVTGIVDLLGEEGTETVILTLDEGDDYNVASSPDNSASINLLDGPYVVGSGCVISGAAIVQ